MKLSNSIQTKFNSVVTASLLLCSAGCGGGAAADAPDLVEAYGVITIDGAPLASARVTFVTIQGSTSGVTDSSGSYKIQYNDKLDGAFPGKTTIVVKRMEPSEMADDPNADGEDEEFEEAEAAAASTDTE